MYQGTNPSALRSREWLRQALLALLQEKSYTQITIKEICARADLSRQTFYQIFESKDEIMQYHFSILFDEFTAQSMTQTADSVTDIFERFFSFFYSHRDFISILTDNHMTNLLEHQFETYLLKITLFRASVSSKQNSDYITAYVAGALTQLLLHWAEKDFDLSVQQLSTLARDTVEGKQFQAP